MSEGGERWATEDEFEDDRDLDRPRRVVGRSGAVTAVAIVNFVWGALNIIGGIVVMVAGPAIMGAVLGAAQQQPGQPDIKQVQGAAGIIAGAAIGIGACVAVFGILFIVAGMGVIQRRQWGRIITIILGIIWGILGVLSLLGNPIQGIISIAYCVFVLVVLFQAKYAAEFR